MLGKAFQEFRLTCPHCSGVNFKTFNGKLSPGFHPLSRFHCFNCGKNFFRAKKVNMVTNISKSSYSYSNINKGLAIKSRRRAFFIAVGLITTLLVATIVVSILGK